MTFRGSFLSFLSKMFGDRNSLQNNFSHMSCFETGCQICRGRDLEVLFTSMQLDLTWDAQIPTKIFPEKASCEADFILKVSQSCKGFWRCLFQPLLKTRPNSKLPQVAQGIAQMNFEYLKRWRFPRLSGLSQVIQSLTDLMLK